MSEFTELIDVKTRIGKILYNGVVINEFRAEQCDNCSQLFRFDEFGYQKLWGEKIIWYCAGCR